MSARQGSKDWDSHSEWVVRSIEELQGEQHEQGKLLRAINEDIRLVVRVAKALGWMIGLVGGAGVWELVKRLLAYLAATGTAAAIIYFG